jgi:Na+/H+ antiporter NhaD/arsenite permease-like protein
MLSFTLPSPFPAFYPPVELALFALTLIGVAIFHDRTTAVALLGLAAITLYKLVITGFAGRPGIGGLAAHLESEWVVLANLFLLLTGFAVVSNQFEASGFPDAMPRVLGTSWWSGLALLSLVFLLSTCLDNIAGALIGGTVARHLFRDRVRLGYVVAIVTAANAGGVASPFGDTTTTMMWIAGVPAARLLPAAVGGVLAFAVLAIPASIQQHRFQPAGGDPSRVVRVDWPRIGVVVAILLLTVLTNVIGNLAAKPLLQSVPLIGLALWLAILLAAPVRRPEWSILRGASKGAGFLLALVTAASMVPVGGLPRPSWASTFGLGFIAAVFDNIPLTSLTLRQGGYDWGLLAYAVGVGGSLLWFGSSAGVALATSFPESRSVRRWFAAAWWNPIAYVTGFFGLLAVFGWRP